MCILIPFHKNAQQQIMILNIL